MTDTANKRGPKGVLEDRTKLVAALRGIRGAEGYDRPSRFIRLKLADAGFVTIVPGETDGTRGRPADVVKLTPRGHAVVNFAR